MSEQNGSPEGGNPAQAGTQAGNWYDTFQDPQIKEWTATKGWKSPESACQSAWHLERLMGADKSGRGVIWPKDDADKDGWNAIYNKLGRPEKPDGYGLKLDEGQDDSYLKHMLPAMHEAGIPKKAAEAIFGKHNEFLQQFHERQEAEKAQKQETQFGKLQQEWGNDFEKNSEIARRAIKIAGLNQEQAEAIEDAIGVDVAAKVFAELGKSFVEHSLPGSFNAGGDTAASAKARIQELTSDPEFGKRLYGGDANAKAEWDKLHKIAYS